MILNEIRQTEQAFEKLVSEARKIDSSSELAVLQDALEELEQNMSLLRQFVQLKQMDATTKRIARLLDVFV